MRNIKQQLHINNEPDWKVGTKLVPEFNMDKLTAGFGFKLNAYKPNDRPSDTSLQVSFILETFESGWQSSTWEVYISGSTDCTVI